MADRIKGITVQIGGDTTGLSKALSGVNKEISSTQSQLKDVERLLKLDPTNTKLLEQKQRLLADAIGDTKTKLDALKQAEKQVQRQFAEGTISQQQYDALQREIVDTEQKLKSLENQARRFGSVFAQQMQEAGGKISEFGDKVSGVGQKLLPVTGAVLGIGAAAVKTSADFDTAMSNVQALSGATGEEYDKLRSAALEMGETTAFSATEAADALGYMALAGWDAEQSTTALPAVLNLAAASCMELAQASDMVTDYLSAFGLAAADAAYFSDLLAFAQANSNTSAEQLGEAYKNCAANLHAAGQDVETVTSMLEAMANQGLKGSEAGTALAAVMRDITAKMEKGSIKIGKISVAVMDADGNFRDMTDILMDVQAATEGMGSAQRAAALSTTFTADSTKGLNLLFNEGMDAVAGYEESLRGGLGSASEQAETRLDNLNGQVTLLKSALEGASISIGETLTPMVAQLVVWVQQAVDWFNSLDASQQRMIVTIALAVAAAGPLIMILGKVISTVGTVTSAAGKLCGFITGTAVPGITSSLSGLFAFMAANPTLMIIAGITVAIIVLVALIAAKGDEIQALLQRVDNFLQGIFARDWTQTFGPVLGGALNLFFSTLKGTWDRAYQLFNGIIDFVRGVFTGDWQRAWQGVKDIFGSIFSGLAGLISGPINAVVGIINGAIGVVDSLLSKLSAASSASVSVPSVKKYRNLPMMASGGVLSQGSAIVGEAGPELLTMAGGRAVVQPLTSSTTHTATFGATNIYVYGAPGQSEQEIAEMVMERIQTETDKRGAVFA